MYVNNTSILTYRYYTKYFFKMKMAVNVLTLVLLQTIIDKMKRPNCSSFRRYVLELTKA